MIDFDQEFRRRALRRFCLRTQSPTSERERAAKVLGMIGVTAEELERDPQGTMKLIAERLRAMAAEKLAALAGG